MRKVSELEDEDRQECISCIFKNQSDYVICSYDERAEFHDYLCLCVFIPPQVSERDGRKKGMKNRRDADRE